MAAAFSLLLPKETWAFYLSCDGKKKGGDDSVKYLGLPHYHKSYTGGVLSWFP